MYSLEPLRIKESGTITRQQHAVGVNPGHCKQPAGRDCLCAITDHFAPLEEFGNERVLLKALKLGVRINHWVAVIQTGDIAEVHDSVLHSINPAAAIRLTIRWIAQRVRNATRRISIIWQFPELLDAQAINLRFLPVIQIQPLRKHLGQRTARSLAEHCNLGAEVYSRLEISLRSAFSVNPLIARSDPDYTVLLVIKHLGPRKLREDIHASFLTLFPKPRS